VENAEQSWLFRGRDAPRALFPQDDIPANIPHEVVRTWAAYFAWWDTRTTQSPRREEFIKKFDQPQPGLRTVDTWRHKWRDLMPSWPLKRGERPPWRHVEAQPEAEPTERTNGHLPEPEPVPVTMGSHRTLQVIAFHDGVMTPVDVIVREDGTLCLPGDPR
jgi:hypothetical protein